jgi:dUTP pyrophosphatase
MILTGREIVKRGIVTDMIDQDIQIQPSGVDLTLNKIEYLTDFGTIDFSNKSRIIPDTFPDSLSSYNLRQGAYIAKLNETITVPSDYQGYAKPRSSLLRVGVDVRSSVFDPGYRGKSQVLLVVHNPKGLRLLPNARILQICFVKMEHEVEKLYDGIYNGENL